MEKSNIVLVTAKVLRSLYMYYGLCRRLAICHFNVGVAVAMLGDFDKKFPALFSWTAQPTARRCLALVSHTGRYHTPASAIFM